MDAAQAVLIALEHGGFKATVVSIEHLRQLGEDLDGVRRQGLLDDGFFRSRLAVFGFDLPASLPEPASIILTAVSQPKVCVTFHVGGAAHQAIIPPTYIYATDAKAQDVITDALEPHGYRAAAAVLPVKPLAVHSGLARYGRNNITHIEGWGSFFRLRAFFSDLPCLGGTWHDLRLREECKTCAACVHSCPTGAISKDRFVIRAERCLSYLNENREPFPGWLDRTSHNSLVGCMICQEVCPINKIQRDWTVAGPDFSEEETTAILSGVPAGELGDGTVCKLAEIDMSEELEILRRNLRVLIEKREG